MRDDIFDENGDLSLKKLLGGGYTKAWFMNNKCRYRLFCGARSTKKSKVIIGYEPIMKIISDPRRNVLIARQNDSDNRQSTFENVCGCITDLGLEEAFKISKNPLVIEYKPTGQQIIFRGLNNPTSLNGITFAHGYFTDAYIDEAFEVPSYDDFRKIDGSLRGRLPDGIKFQVTMCFNAWDGDSWLNQEFFKNRLDDDFATLDRDDVTYMDYYDPEFVGPYGKGLYLHKSTYKINEFRDFENYDAAALEMRRKAPEIYKVEFLGMFGNTTAAVYPEWSDELVMPSLTLLGTGPNCSTKTQWADFAIGVDTGLSDGGGHVLKVGKNENADLKVRAATTMALCAITSDLQKVAVIDEYFHSNNKADNMTNTDDRENIGLPEQADRLLRTIVEWIQRYGELGTALMRGTIHVYVDSADVGFRQILEMKAREYGLYNLKFAASTKLSIQTRVDFDRLLMAYGDFIVSDRCKNLVREIKNARRGKKGEARQDGNDHMLTCVEYAKAPLLPSMRRWKTFKVH